MNDYPTIPLGNYREYPIEEMRKRLREFYEDVKRRRTVREYSDRQDGTDYAKDKVVTGAKLLPTYASPGLRP